MVAIDWDRRYFDELVPLPHGTTYNSYVVRGSQKTALIDTMYPALTVDYISTLKRLAIPRLDYIVADHGEQDHSGAIPAVLALYPEAKVITNKICRNLIRDAIDVPEERFQLIKNGDTLDLGDRTLRFLLAPWVHWPDTMFTHLVEDNLLFTCDLFGAHDATSDLFAHDAGRVLSTARRYYAEIMMPFREHVVRYLEQITALQPRMICASHGPIHDRPALILDAYREWAAAAPRPEVVIPHVSMYKNTSDMVRYLVDRLMERGLKVTPFNCVDGDLGELASALVTASTAVIAVSTALDGPHPSSIGALNLMNILKPKLRFAATLGSYGWQGSIAEKIRALLPNLNVKFLDSVHVRGKAHAEDLAALDKLAAEIGECNRELMPGA